MKQVKEFISSEAIWQEEKTLNEVNDFCKQNKVVDIIPKVFVGMNRRPMFAYIVIYEVEKWVTDLQLNKKKYQRAENMRVLKGWTKDEQKELEEAKDNGFFSDLTLFRGIAGDEGGCHVLSKKYYREDLKDNNQMAKDIVDFYCGNAKFHEQKYYVKLIKNDGAGYLNRNKLYNCCVLNSCCPGLNFQTEFTEDEIKDIDPRYMAFAVPVEESKWIIYQMKLYIYLRF